MNPILRNIIAVILGLVGGSVVNMGLVQLGHSTMPIEGVDSGDMEALARAMPSLEAQYFVFPFLAHAVGTLLGAFLAGLIGVKHKMKLAMGIGVLFLLGGIAASFMLPAPVWFIAADLILAYLPMAWLGGKMATAIKRS